MDNNGMGCAMNINDKVSTGLKGFDQVIDNLRLGDNVVWQADSISIIRKWLIILLQMQSWII